MAAACHLHSCPLLRLETLPYGVNAVDARELKAHNRTEDRDEQVVAHVVAGGVVNCAPASMILGCRARGERSCSSARPVITSTTLATSATDP
jgi:hypothetical protein